MRIYLDHHATTPVDERVMEAMRPYFSGRFGNASSVDHDFGTEAADAVERAREQVASLIHARPGDIVFTSGATESNNLALHGGKIVTLATEHPSVLELARREKATVLPVNGDGRVDPEALRPAITGDTTRVSVMHANNEIGVIQDIESIATLCREKGVWFHTDAAESVGKIPFDADWVDLASISAHKLYGPKGVGALYVRSRKPRVLLQPLFAGGGHEAGLRPGTLPVPLIVGFGEACALAERERDDEAKRIMELRERLRMGIISELDHVTINGSLEHRLPGNLNVSFGFVEGGELVDALYGIAVSTGAACATGKHEPSHVLRALNVPEPLAPSTIRFGLGRGTTREEIEITLDRLIRAVRQLREKSPLYSGETK